MKALLRRTFLCGALALLIFFLNHAPLFLALSLSISPPFFLLLFPESRYTGPRHDDGMIGKALFEALSVVSQVVDLGLLCEDDGRAERVLDEAPL